MGQVIVLEEYAGFDLTSDIYLWWRLFLAGIRDVRFNPIRFAQGQVEEPDLRGNIPLRGHRGHDLSPTKNNYLTIIGK